MLEYSKLIKEAENAGFTDIFIHKDLAGLLRLVEAHIN